MATGRILKKQISLSEQVNSLSLKAALLYTWTLAHADDFGRLPGSPRRIKAQVVPMRDDISVEDVSNCLREMHQAGLIIWYSVADELFIQFPTWELHQSGLHKRTASKYPPPPETAQDGVPELPGSSRTFPEIPPRTEQNRTEQEQEQERNSSTPLSGSDTKDSKLPKPEYTDDFETFWTAYPKRIGKKAAFDKWRTRLRQGVTPAELIIAAKHYATACSQDHREERYIMQPETFLGPKERWKDYINPPPQEQHPRASPAPRARGLAALQAELQRVRSGGAPDDL